MKIKLNRNTYIFFAFFITTIGNSSFLTQKGLDEIVTYSGIALILSGIIYSRFRNMKRNRLRHKTNHCC